MKKKNWSEIKIGYGYREFVIKCNDFRGIYSFFFFVKLVIGWSKNLCNLILVVGFNFDANLIVRSSLKLLGSIHNRWIKSGLQI